MHLIAKRAWCDIHSALNTFDSMKNKINGNNENNGFNPEEENLKLLITPMFKLGEIIDKTFELYHKAMIANQKSFKNKFKSAVNSIFQNNEKTLRDKIQFGLEGKDFTRD